MNVIKKPDRKAIYYILLLALLGLIITGYFLYKYQEENHELELHKRLLIERLAGTVNDYNDLKTENDSLRDRILSDQNRMLSLMDSVDLVTLDNREKLRSFEETFLNMRDQLQRLRIQVDSLQELSDSLSRENFTMKIENQRLADTTEKLQRNILENSGLKINTLKAEAINNKWSGQQEITHDNYWTDFMKICYGITENNLAEKGVKSIFVRIIQPDNTILKSSDEEATIELDDGSTLYYTSVRNFTYEGAVVEGCFEIYREKFEEGEYTVELYLEGKKQSATQLLLD